MAHAKTIEYETERPRAQFNVWNLPTDHKPSLEREPWRALRSSAAIHFVGPSWWREWDPESLPQQAKDELLSTLEARWAVCVAYWHLQAHGSLEQAVARTLELDRMPLTAESKPLTELESGIASKLDLVANAGLVVRLKKSGRITLVFELYGKRLVVSAKDLRTLARQFCMAAAPNFDHALAL